MKKVYLIVIIVVVVIVGWLVISRNNKNQNISPSADNSNPIGNQPQPEKAPDFKLQDYNGKTVSLSDFAGKPIVINSWAAWCPFCKKEIPDFVTAQKEFGDKIVIIAIDRSESLAVAKGYTDQQETTDSLIFLLDPEDSFYKSIGGFSMPETIFVDKNGNIIDHKRGPMDINEIRQKIEKILSIKPVNK